MKKNTSLTPSLSSSFEEIKNLINNTLRSIISSNAEFRETLVSSFF